jgi:membrane-associated protease RseP (regulator of RpoE activity)
MPPAESMEPSPDPWSRPGTTPGEPGTWPPSPGHTWTAWPRRPKDRIWLHVLLLVATALTTTIVGADQYYSFLTDFGARRVIVRSALPFLLGGLWYSLTILAILGAHEMGHYLACRYYRISASLPYFIPFPPLLFVTGTLGAVIRIRQPFGSKRQLFDVGVAGPFAGFLVALPALFVGLSLSNVARVPSNFVGFDLGEPLLYQFASRLLRGPIPDGYSVNLHPMAFAAWLGLLVTMLNLLPFWQLDGGHVSYAVFGRRSRIVSLATAAITIVLTFVSLSWSLWALLMVVILVVVGPSHPPIADEDAALDPSRRWLAVAALAVFVVCFMPAPIQPLDLLHR